MDWYYIDNLKVYYLYRKIKEDCNLKRFTSSSIGYKLSNYSFLHTGKDHENCSEESIDIYKQFKDKSLEEIKEEIDIYEADREESLGEMTPQSSEKSQKTQIEEAHKKLSLIIKKAEEIKDEVLFLSEEVTDLCGDILESLNRTNS